MRNRAALLAAARVAFTERGLDAPLEPIAAAAGLGNATLYRHFPTRAALWEAVLRDPLQEVADLVDECLALSRSDPWEGFASFVRETADIEARRTGFSELMTTRYEGAPQLLQLRAQIQGGVEQLFARAAGVGAVRADVVLEDVALVQISIAEIIRTFGAVAPDVYRRWVDLTLDAMRSPGSPREELRSRPLRPNQVWRALMRKRGGE